MFDGMQLGDAGHPMFGSGIFGVFGKDTSLVKRMEDLKELKQLAEVSLGQTGVDYVDMITKAVNAQNHIGAYSLADATVAMAKASLPMLAMSSPSYWMGLGLGRGFP